MTKGAFRVEIAGFGPERAADNWEAVPISVRSP
jgi:hypothetical protein